jgi:DNA-binding LacI/PurR family transcriptional regulator
MIKRANPTIYDVSAITGLSVATISRVINSPDKVKAETRERVMAAIDNLGFVPKAEARARTLQSFQRIGVITPFFTAPSFVQRLRGVAAALSGTGYELVIYTIESSKQLEGYLASLPITGSLDGLIVISLPFGEKDANRLINHGLETILIEYPQERFSTVEIDDVAGGRMAVEYLLNKGHRKIAFLGDTDLPEYAIHPVSLRLKGFRIAIEEAGLSLPEEYVRLGPCSYESAKDIAHQMLTLPTPPTAIFSATDLQAMGVLKAAAAMGRRIPQDLAILGFDNLDIAEYVGLSTINQPLDESGKIAVELLLNRITNPETALRHVNLPLTIIERETT